MLRFAGDLHNGRRIFNNNKNIDLLPISTAVRPATFSKITTETSRFAGPPCYIQAQHSRGRTCPGFFDTGRCAPCCEHTETSFGRSETSKTEETRGTIRCSHRRKDLEFGRRVSAETPVLCRDILNDISDQTLSTANRESSNLASCRPSQFATHNFQGLYKRGPADFYEDVPLPLFWMTTQLEAIFGELGITQYLDIFLEQGFDTWETILDITESDLDALGVKLGHRRKLQRRIANFRGLSLDAPIVSPPIPPTTDEPKQEQQPAPVKVETHDVPATVVVAKRKYRRHPKPDENAPERPPSAYVLFSNKMRDDLKGRNLTFTEIAKLVGEHWQNLSVAEKEPFESQAQAAKDRYNAQLTEYKKTPAYKRYQEYLEEFKTKYAHQSKDKEATKRMKLSPDASNNERRTPNQIKPSRSGSGSPSANTMKGETHRHHRLSSVVSATDSHVSATPAFYPASLDDAVRSPSDRRSSERSPVIKPSPRDIGMAHRRTAMWHDDQSSEHTGPPRLLPSLSDVFDPIPPSLSSGHSSTDLNGYPFPRSYSRDSAGPPPDLVEGKSKAPTLKKEQSSAGSISSGSSYSFPRTPIEGSLPIHALLSEKAPQPLSSMMQFHGTPMVTTDHKSPFLQRQPPEGVVLPYTNGFPSAPSHTPQQQSPLGTTLVTTPQQSHSAQPRPSQTGVKREEPDLDGMTALLRAGEIVDKRPT